MIRLAMVSRWHVHANDYARNALENPHVKITAVWDDDAARGREWADQLGAVFYADYDELLRSDIDAVIVASSTNLHTGLLTKAAKAGKHIFTEKVLTFTKKDAEAVREAVLESKIHFAISLPHKTQGSLLKAKELVDQGALGDITYMRVRNVHSGSINNWLPDFFYNKELCGGGAMMDLGAHPMYTLSWFLGRPVKVTSIFTNVTHRAVEDNSVTTMCFANGAIGVSETGFVSQTDPYILEISGTKGYLRIHNKKELEYISLDTDKQWVKLETSNPDKRCPLDIWVDGIRSNTQNELYGIDAAVALSELMEAAYTSDRSNTIVQL